MLLYPFALPDLFTFIRGHISYALLCRGDALAYRMPLFVFKHLILNKGAGKTIRMQKISTVHELEMKMGKHGITAVSDAADAVVCLYMLSLRDRNRIWLQVTEGGIDRICILNYDCIAGYVTYFLILLEAANFKRSQSICEQAGTRSFFAAIHHIYNRSITRRIYRLSIAIARREWDAEQQVLKHMGAIAGMSASIPIQLQKIIGISGSKRIRSMTGYATSRCIGRIPFTC